MQNTFSIGMLLAYVSYRQQFVGKAHGMVDKIIEYIMVSLHLERAADIVLAEPKPNMQGDPATNVKGAVRTEGLAFRYSDEVPRTLTWRRSGHKQDGYAHLPVSRLPGQG